MAAQPSEPIGIPESRKDLLSWDKKAFVNLALVRKNGRPHVSPVWFEWDGQHVIINTARGRVKDKILHRHPVVALAIMDPADPYRYLLLEGPVVDESEAGGYEMISRLNEKYHGNPNYPKVAGQVRVTYKILPARVFPKS